MAFIATLETEFGTTQDLYLRLNNVEVSNHGVAARALFRGYASEAQFQAGKRYMAEFEITFDADVSAPIWPQAYAALAGNDPVGTLPADLATAQTAAAALATEQAELATAWDALQADLIAEPVEADFETPEAFAEASGLYADQQAAISAITQHRSRVASEITANAATVTELQEALTRASALKAALESMEVA